MTLCPKCGLLQVVIDCFAGPGGWDEGLRILGRHEDGVGVEWDEAACRTARAAGHRRLQGDVSRVPIPRGFCVRGYLGSPPCQGWSKAGKGKSTLDRPKVHELVDRMARGDDAHDFTEWQDPRSSLAAEPVRWVRELKPQWIALEQVPAVLPLWEHIAEVYRGWGYSVWTGILDTADYGVPQNRKRAFLMASRLGAVSPPQPTHAKVPQEAGLLSAGRRKWVSMAEALLWGSEDAVGFPRRYDGQGEPLTLDGEECRARDLRPTDQPAQVVTEKARSWSRYPEAMRGSGNVGGSADRATDDPAPTITGAGSAVWVDPAEVVYVNGTHEHAARKPADQPAPTVMFGARLNTVEWQFSATNVRPNSAARGADEPAPTLAFGHEEPRWLTEEQVAEQQRAAVAARVEPRVNNQSGTLFDLAWPLDRPAPTVAGREIVPMPGANANRFNGATKSRNDGIRVAPDEAATLQSFPLRYPWSGTKTETFRQIGDAVPPLMAAHILAALGEGKVPEELVEHGWRATERRDWQ